MKKVVSYQLLCIGVILPLWAQGPLQNLPEWLIDYRLAIDCILIASTGGVLYGIRATYVNFSARQCWDSRWEVWYYLRPVASAICGLVAYVFLSAGILVLEASQSHDSSNFGFLAFAFVAGFNVDRFLQKVESVAVSSFGIDQSRSRNPDD